MSTIRLATYNIHKFAGSDGKRDPDRTIGVIKAMDADIVAIQEFVADEGGPGVEAFAAAAGYRATAQRMRRRNGQYQFNLLFARLELRAVRRVDLICKHVEPRGAILAEVQIGEHALKIAATHLGLTPGARARQLDMLLRECGGAPFALMGDVNAMFPWERVQRRIARAFPGTARPATYPVRRPILALDRIAVRPASAARELRAYREGDAPTASDHLPLIADIALS